MPHTPFSIERCTRPSRTASDGPLPSVELCSPRRVRRLTSCPCVAGRVVVQVVPRSRPSTPLTRPLTAGQSATDTCLLLIHLTHIKLFTATDTPFGSSLTYNNRLLAPAAFTTDTASAPDACFPACPLPLHLFSRLMLSCPARHHRERSNSFSKKNDPAHRPRHDNHKDHHHKDHHHDGKGSFFKKGTAPNGPNKGDHFNSEWPGEEDRGGGGS